MGGTVTCSLLDPPATRIPATILTIHTTSTIVAISRRSPHVSPPPAASTRSSRPRQPGHSAHLVQPVGTMVSMIPLPAGCCVGADHHRPAGQSDCRGRTGRTGHRRSAACGWGCADHHGRAVYYRYSDCMSPRGQGRARAAVGTIGMTPRTGKRGIRAISGRGSGRMDR